jgi:hypothetical protein
LPDLPWITSQVENSPNHNYRSLFHPVIDGIRKSLGQHAMIAEKLRVDPAVQRQRVNIGK